MRKYFSITVTTALIFVFSVSVWSRNLTINNSEKIEDVYSQDGGGFLQVIVNAKLDTCWTDTIKPIGKSLITCIDTKVGPFLVCQPVDENSKIRPVGNYLNKTDSSVLFLKNQHIWPTKYPDFVRFFVGDLAYVIKEQSVSKHLKDKFLLQDNDTIPLLQAVNLYDGIVRGTLTKFHNINWSLIESEIKSIRLTVYEIIKTHEFTLIKTADENDNIFWLKSSRYFFTYQQPPKDVITQSRKLKTNSALYYDYFENGDNISYKTIDSHQTSTINSSPDRYAVWKNKSLKKKEIEIGKSYEFILSPVEFMPENDCISNDEVYVENDSKDNSLEHNTSQHLYYALNLTGTRLNSFSMDNFIDSVISKYKNDELIFIYNNLYIVN